MTIKTCDCCGKQTDNLITIYERYKVENVSEICESCESEINEQLANINKTTVILKNNFITQFIHNLKSRLSKQTP